MKKALALMPFLFLAGCKVEIIAPIELSKIQSDETFDVELDFEVPACNDYEDSRKPSQGLVDLIEKVKEGLPELEYKECYSKGMYSFASYNIEGIYINEEDIAQHKDEINVQIAFNEDEAGMYNLLFVLPASLRNRIHKLQDESYVSFTPEVTIEINNDTDGKKAVAGIYSYVNNNPSDMIWSGVTDVGESNTITLSNVMSDRLLLEIDKNESNAVYFMAFGEPDEE